MRKGLLARDEKGLERLREAGDDDTERGDVGTESGDCALGDKIC